MSRIPPALSSEVLGREVAVLLHVFLLNFVEQIARFPPHPDRFLRTLQLHVPHVSTAPILAVAAFLLGKGSYGWI